MKDALIALQIKILLFVLATIAFCCWRSYGLFKHIHGVAPFPLGFGFSNFMCTLLMCTLLMPDWYRGRQALLASQSPEARLEIAALARRMRIGILIAAALVVLDSMAIIASARP
jgi:hypothetical protein